MLVIQDLINIKNKLLQKHRQYEVPNADEYRSGLLTGIEVALQSIDELLESESDAMAREYGENEKRWSEAQLMMVLGLVDLGHVDLDPSSLYSLYILFTPGCKHTQNTPGVKYHGEYPNL